MTVGVAALPRSAHPDEGPDVCERRERCEEWAEREGTEVRGLDEHSAQSVGTALAWNFEVMSLSETM